MKHSIFRFGARDEDERFAMVKYMVDSYIAEFNAKEYSNLELAGFYWFDESFDTQKGAEYRRATDYIRSGYDELYRYIHQNIAANELWIEEYDKPQEWLEGATEYL